MLKNTEHGLNYKEQIPQEINDFNIAKANNAIESLEKDMRGFMGHCNMARIGSEILAKINKDMYAYDGLPTHSKFTYQELGVLKYYAENLNLENKSAYNGIAQKGLFSNTRPFNIEITQSLSKDSDFAKKFENSVVNHKNKVNDFIISNNNQTFKLID
jgi:predicted RNA-binding protein Jag